MKKIIPFLFLVSFFVPASFGEIIFDHTISDVTGYEILTVNLNDESLLITGAGADRIYANGESYIEVQGTSPVQHNIGGIYTLNLTDESIMSYYDGEMSGFRIYNDATATFSGGRIDYISSYQDSDILKHITFIVDLDSIDLTGNLLTGDWLGGGSFAVTLLDQDPTKYDSVYSNINFIPEPASLALLGLGGAALRRKKH